MKYFLPFFLVLFFTACATFKAPQEFSYTPVKQNTYTLATWQKITDEKEPIYIFMEGDGNAFNYRGLPTKDPTPKSTFLRNLAFKNTNKNIVYLARPCQYIKAQNCKEEDWTGGRFSPKIVSDTARTIKQIAQDKEIILIGYSGGALLSGLIIKNYPELKIKKWITVAGVLNHKEWTEFFGDKPLTKSLNLKTLPNVPQVHYAGAKDKIVPLELSKKWTKEKNLIIVPKAKHNGHFDLSEI
jgi:Serine hydrolase (FSH1).